MFVKKTFDLMGHDYVELPLKTKIDSDDRKWLEQSKSRYLKQFDDNERANLILSRTEKQLKN